MRVPPKDPCDFVKEDFYEIASKHDNQLSHFEVFEKIANAGYTVKTSHGFGNGYQSWTFEKYVDA